eukprot:1369327-Ditylum_brightwellii.AAC.1
MMLMMVLTMVMMIVLTMVMMVALIMVLRVMASNSHISPKQLIVVGKRKQNEHLVCDKDNDVDDGVDN